MTATTPGCGSTTDARKRLAEAQAQAAADVESCAAVVFRGSRWGNNPEPDEQCENDAEPGSEFCVHHGYEDDE